MRFLILLGAVFSEKYHVSPLSILWHCFDVVFNAPKCLQDCMLSVGLRWHTNEQVQWPGDKNVMKYMTSDYKPAPLLLFTFDPIFFDQISYILVISTKFLLCLWRLTPYICIIFCLYKFLYKSNIRYILVISIKFPTIWVYIWLYNEDLILIDFCDFWLHIEVNLLFLMSMQYIIKF